MGAWEASEAPPPALDFWGHAARPTQATSAILNRIAWISL